MRKTKKKQEKDPCKVYRKFTKTKLLKFNKLSLDLPKIFTEIN